MTDTQEIDRVSEAMQSIVNKSLERESATGYFAAMYLGVTREVKRGLEDNIFTTPDRLVNLATVFAQRYIDAWDLHEAGDRPTESWQLAFDAAKEWRPTVLQHLLLGMNAHINLDLGIASAEVAPGEAIGDLRTDFEQINDVLARLVQAVQGRLNRVSPFYRMVDHLGGSADEAVINFSIARARDEAWKLATFLAAADEQDAAKRITRKDRSVAQFGSTILRPGAVPSAGLFAVRITEKRSPSAIIEILSAAVN